MIQVGDILKIRSDLIPGRAYGRVTFAPQMRYLLGTEVVVLTCENMSIRQSQTLYSSTTPPQVITIYRVAIRGMTVTTNVPFVFSEEMFEVESSMLVIGVVYRCKNGVKVEKIGGKIVDESGRTISDASSYQYSYERDMFVHKNNDALSFSVLFTKEEGASNG